MVTRSRKNRAGNKLLLLGSQVRITNLPVKEVSLLGEGSLPGKIAGLGAGQPLPEILDNKCTISTFLNKFCCSENNL